MDKEKFNVYCAEVMGWKEGNGNSFLTVDDVIGIKKMLADGASYLVISNKFR